MFQTALSVGAIARIDDVKQFERVAFQREIPFPVESRKI